MVFIFLIGCNAQEGVSSKFHFEKLGDADTESDAAIALAGYLLSNQSFESHDQLTRTEPLIPWRRFKRFCFPRTVAIAVGCLSLAAFAGCILFVAIASTRNRD